MVIALIRQEGGGAMLNLTPKQNEFIVNANHRYNFKEG